MTQNSQNDISDESLESLLQEVMPQDQARELERQYEDAVEMTRLSKHDVDRVHGLLAECVINDPGNVRYAQALLDNLRRKDAAGEPQAPPPGKNRLTQAVEAGDWKRVLRVGMDLLRHDPGDAQTLATIARACEACNCSKVELLFLRHALDASPDDTDLNRRMAQVLAGLERFDEAIACWERIEDADRYDVEPPRMILALTLEKTRHLGDLSRDEPQAEDGSADTVQAESDAATDAANAEPERKKPRKLVLTPRQQLEQEVVNHPEDEQRYLKLAEFHLSEGRTFDAQRTLTKALEVASDDRVRERLEDVNMLRGQERVRAARQRAAQERTPAAYEMVEKLRDESHQLELDIYKRRYERNPDDQAVRFELGVRLKQAGHYQEAMEPLKDGLHLPSCRAVAYLEIGEILQRYHRFPKALQCYRQAARFAAQEPAQAECRKRALYRAASLATTMKLTDSARKYFSELVGIAPTYRDAKTRLDRLAGMSQNGGSGRTARP